MTGQKAALPHNVYARACECETWAHATPSLSQIRDPLNTRDILMYREHTVLTLLELLPRKLRSGKAVSEIPTGNDGYVAVLRYVAQCAMLSWELSLSCLVLAHYCNLNRCYHGNTSHHDGALPFGYLHQRWAYAIHGNMIALCTFGERSRSPVDAKRYVALQIYEEQFSTDSQVGARSLL